MKKDFYFNAEAACRYGVDEAVLLNALAFWVEKNHRAERNRYEGRYWTHHTQAALLSRFPFWTRRQLERIIASCRAKGALLAEPLSPNKTDRTLWYTLTDEALALYGTLPESTSPDGETDSGLLPPSGSRNGESRPTEAGGPFPRAVDSIKVTVPTPVPDTDTTLFTPAGGDEREDRYFLRFWDDYPCKENRDEALRAWNAMPMDAGLLLRIARAIEWQAHVKAAFPPADEWLNSQGWKRLY